MSLQEHFIIGSVILAIGFNFGFFTGMTIIEERMQLDAIYAGLAEYDCDEDSSECEFQWIVGE